MHSDALWESWADLLADQGFVVIDHFLPDPILADLLAFFQTKQDELTPARVGALGERQQLSEVRSDLTFWLDKPRDTALASVFAWIEVRDARGASDARAAGRGRRCPFRRSARPAGG